MKHTAQKILLSAVILLVLAFGLAGITPAFAAINRPPNAQHPAGLSDSDWAQIRSMLSISQQAYLKASNTGTNDQFGLDVAISGDTVVVGADTEDSNATGVNGDDTNNSASNAGAVYVFTRSGTSWSQQAYLKASNTGAGDFFGSSVAISGDTIVVGAIGESSNATGVNGSQSNNSASNAGAAYVFTRSGTSWSQQAYLKASNTEASDKFGASVAISGDTVIVGAIEEDSNATGVNGDGTNSSASNAGAVYVFTRSGTNWSQQAYLKASNTGANDEFGTSLAISGDTIVVGTEKEDSNATGVNGNEADNSASASGAAYVFTRSGTSWSQQAYLKASNTETIDQFGTSVAISSDTIVVGAWSEDSNATGVNGNEANNSASVSGAAYVFTRSGTSWSQQAYLKASNTEANDTFGRSVAIAGDTVVVGAQSEDSSATGVDGNEADNSAAASGAAYVFTRSGTSWSQQNYLKASNTDAGDQFGGYSIAISGDTVVVGTHLESSNATGVNGNGADNSASASGAAYVFYVTPPPTLTPTPTWTHTPIPPTLTPTLTSTITPTPFKSSAAEDGWIIGTTATPPAGYFVYSTGSAFILGDDASNGQYRAILSFDTSALPDNATVQSAVLRIKFSSQDDGVDPFISLGSLRVDIREGTFGTSVLETGDFSAATSNSILFPVSTVNPTPVSNWYSATLNSTGRFYINVSGRTQFRLGFTVETNGNSTADTIRFIAGDYGSNPPELVITYTTP